jgi:hypothetical protein
MLHQTQINLRNTMNENLESFIKGYLACALWSSSNADGEGLDSLGFGVDNLAPETLERMRADCASFFYRALPWINGETAPHSSKVDADRYRSAGHDFWFTSSGHGVGFWDGAWPEYGEVLAKHAKNYPVESLYEGDDGNLYVS